MAVITFSKGTTVLWEMVLKFFSICRFSNQLISFHRIYERNELDNILASQKLSNNGIIHTCLD